MAITTRQGNLLAAEDWKKLYQTFREADFQSYDFETLRKSMIDYLRLYYPEDFNDFVESSEFIALIDLIAFLGQSLAFRADLNARENFIDTAERRDSILKLAKLISYVPKRNIPASGLLKIENVRTTETVYDSDGINLSGQIITWNDSANNNWLEQFITVLNAALINSQRVGRPGNSSVINSNKIDEYKINLAQSILPLFKFVSNVDSRTMGFEIVSGTTVDKPYVYEQAPKPAGTFNFLYQNDNHGNNSINTGFFLYAKQGELKSVDLNITESLPNRIVNVNIDNINQSDVWLYSLDTQGRPDVLWEQVPAIAGTNIAYNNISNFNRKIYQVSTRANDQIDLVFGDGVFADIPQGNYRVYFRQSNGLAYKINPEEVQNVPVAIQYLSRNNRIETLTFTASLKYTISNSAARETLEEIRQRAPQQYYTQNRIVNGEDYNIFPYTHFNNIVKIKAVNRTSSGISRFLDVVDTTGKYSSTNIFCQDGILYQDEVMRSFTFDFINKSDILRVIKDRINPILRSKEILHYYYERFARYDSPETTWQQSTTASGQSTGYFYKTVDNSPILLQIGTYVSNNRKYIRPGSLIKFVAPTGKYFDVNNNLKNITSVPLTETDKFELLTSVVSVVDDGINQGAGNLQNGNGPVVLNDVIPTGALIGEIIPPFSNNIDPALSQQLTDMISLFKEFGLRYDAVTQMWKVVTIENIATVDNLGNEIPFSESQAGNESNNNLDASWLIRFVTDGSTYTAYYRNLDFIFESALETRFYFDRTVRAFDSKTGQTLHDNIKVLKVNTKPDSVEPLGKDYTLYIYDNIIESDGYENNSKIKVTFVDKDTDSIPDYIDFFKEIVAPLTNSSKKHVFFKRVIGYDNFAKYVPVATGTINSSYPYSSVIISEIERWDDGQLFYAYETNTFYQLSIDQKNYTLNETSEYIAKVGVADLYFQYRHNTPNNRRIDPSPNNIIDLFVLTKQYERDYRAWVEDTSGKIVKPDLPNAEELRIEFSDIENYKPMSDAIIFNPVKFKPLFGDKAASNLQATFKVIKNPNVNVSDSEVKSKLIQAVNNYFAIENWDFGDTFYFSELSTYLHQQLTPLVASILILPASTELSFGDLLQVNSAPDEILVSAATVDNVQVISAITAAQLGILK